MFITYESLDEYIISRLGVGHTHIDIDRLFSYLNQTLFGIGRGGSRSGENVMTHEDFKNLFFKAMSDKKDVMLLDHKFEDLNFTYDFWSLFRPHQYDDLSGYGSSGPVHVMRFKRNPNHWHPHVSYKYWWQSKQWLPADGSSLRILETCPTPTELRTIGVSPYIDDHQEIVRKFQKPVLTWLQKQVQLNLATNEHVNSWKQYFRNLPIIPKASFLAQFPPNRNALDVTVSVKQENASALSKLIVKTQEGPTVEPITYPGYTKSMRKSKRKQINDRPDITLAVKRFAFVNIPIDDPTYLLKLCLVRITRIHDHDIEFDFYIYRGYPHKCPDNYRGPWSRSIRPGKGQTTEQGNCSKDNVVLTFSSLTQAGLVPASNRLSAGKMIERVCAGDFGNYQRALRVILLDSSCEFSSAINNNDPS